MVITGTWKDGSPMTAIPNFARMNRVAPLAEYPGDNAVTYAPGATTSSGVVAASRGPQKDAPAIPAIATPRAGSGDTRTTTIAGSRDHGRSIQVDSKVWI